MTNRVFRIFFSVVLLLGLAAGYWLAALPGLQTNELLNLVGLSYNFLGVLVLSELLAVSATWKNICVKFLAPGALWLHTLIPLGACVGAQLHEVRTLSRASGVVGAIQLMRISPVAHFFFLFFGYSLLPLSVLNEFVVLPQLPFAKRDIESRWRWFGLFLLLSGIAFQLIAVLLAIRRQ
jgi:hypothetical protein